MAIFFCLNACLQMSVYIAAENNYAMCVKASGLVVKVFFLFFFLISMTSPGSEHPSWFLCVVL